MPNMFLLLSAVKTLDNIEQSSRPFMHTQADALINAESLDRLLESMPLSSCPTGAPFLVTKNFVIQDARYMHTKSFFQEQSRYQCPILVCSPAILLWCKLPSRTHPRIIFKTQPQARGAQSLTADCHPPPWPLPASRSRTPAI